MSQLTSLFAFGIIVLAVTHAALVVETVEPWSYKCQELWMDTCQYGKAQSPINLIEADATAMEAGKSVRFNYERVGVNYNVFTENDGNTLTFRAPEESAHIVVDGDKKYKLVKVIYHWGKSEHQIDGTTFQGELEFVHHGMKAESTDGKTVIKTDEKDIVIASVFLKENFALSISQERPEFVGFKGTFASVVYPYSSAATFFSTRTISFERMLPEIKEYFRYTGSLSAPPCTESVERIVFKHPVHVTRDLFVQLKSLINKDGETMVNNARDLKANVLPVSKSF